MRKATLAALALVVILAPSAAQAATRLDVANEARAITAQLDACDHPSDTVALAYLQARKGVQIVQMTTLVGYTATPIEADVAAMVGRVIPAPRTTVTRLLDDGLMWLGRARSTLEGATPCRPS